MAYTTRQQVLGVQKSVALVEFLQEHAPLSFLLSEEAFVEDKDDREYSYPLVTGYRYDDPTRPS